jgi:prophage tail gpP-like protein
MILKINDRIRNRQVSNFNNVSVSLKFDASASTFSFSYYFNPQNPEHKELMCIGHYHECTVEFENELLITGNVLSEGFSDEPQIQMVALSGYSKSGVIEDCQISPDHYPLQSDGLSLKDIANKLLRPFGITAVVDSLVSSEMNEVFETTEAKETQSIKSYLSELAAQKNVILSNDNKGNLVFTKAKTKQTPIAVFDQNNRKALSTKLSFNGQGMHSHITVLKEADEGNAGEETIRNPYVISSVFRPKVIKQSSGDDVDTSKAVRAALASELKNLKLTLTLDSWTIDGKIIRPNNLITVENENVYLYKRANWFIESVDLTGNNKQQTAVLNCVLPEVYNNEIPEYLFKGINLRGHE